jgi:hypothetical protein
MTTLEHLQQERYTARALKSRSFIAWEASRAPPTGAPKSRGRLCYPGRQTLGASSRARHKAAVCAPLNAMNFLSRLLFSSPRSPCAVAPCQDAAVPPWSVGLPRRSHAPHPRHLRHAGVGRTRVRRNGVATLDKLSLEEAEFLAPLPPPSAPRPDEDRHRHAQRRLLIT